MKRLAVLIALCLFGCGEKEPPLRPRLQKKDPAVCSIDWKAFKELKRVDDGLITRTSTCLEAQIEDGFRQVKGKLEGELSIDEIRLLAVEGILDSPAKEEVDWDAARTVLPLFHPTGRPALSLEAARRWCRLARRHARFVPDWYAHKNPAPGVSPLASDILPILLRGLDMADEAMPLLYSGYEVSLERVRKVVRGLLWAHGDAPVASEIEAQIGRLEAMWTLKSLLLPDLDRQGDGFPFQARGLKLLIQALGSAFRGGITTESWFFDFLPHLRPASFESDMGFMADKLKSYFTDHPFAAIDAASLTLAARKLSSPTGIVSLMEDLTRISQRLAPAGKSPKGLHASTIAEFLSDTPKLVKEVRAASDAFPRCPPRHEGNCEVTMRAGMAAPALAAVIQKGAPRVPLNEKYERVFPTRYRDLKVSWSDVFLRLGKRAIVRKIFEAFDADRDGKLPLTGAFQEDLKETLDLTYAMLRFISYSTAKGDAKEIPAYIVVKPSSFYGLLGILGDRWVVGGNGDKELSADELFSIAQVYDEIQHSAETGRAATPYVPAALWNGKQFHLDAHREAVYRRDEFVRNAASGFSYSVPWISERIKGLPEARVQSFHHGLVSIDRKRPAPFFNHYKRPVGAPVDLTYRVTAADNLPAGAILVGLETLMHNCDRNEDKSLDWAEMDCALPMALDVGHKVVTSAMVELDPGVHDLSRVLLVFLQRPGLPLSIAKLALANGSLTEFRGLSTLKNPLTWLTLLARHPDIEVDLVKFTAFARRLSREATAAEKDEMDKELRRLAEVGVAFVKDYLANGGDGHAKFERIVKDEIETFAKRVGLKKPEQLLKLLSLLPIATDESKFISVLEEILRREKGIDEFKDP